MKHGDISAAAKLVRYALGPKDRPNTGSPYRALLDRYRTDVAFQEITDRIADGLGLDIHGVSQLGLLLSGRLEGPFAVTIDNSGLPIRKGEGRLQDRLCFGLVLVALAAHAYPNGESLVDTGNRTVRPVDIERFLARRIAGLAAIDESRTDMDGQLGTAAAMWLALPPVLPAERGGGMRRECQRWYVTQLLTFLVARGRAQREPALDDDGGEAYVLNDRFRIGLSEVAESLLFEPPTTGMEDEVG